MDRALVSLGQTKPHPLDLQQLRSDLSALWREEGKGVLRACHATLVLVVSPGEDPDPLIEDLVLTHPSRVLCIQPDPKLPPRDIVSWASCCCMKRSSGMLVCSETLRFVTGEGADERLPSIVRSLAVGGLPLVVICRETSPLHLSWIDAIREEADMIVGRSGGLELGEALELWRESTKARGTRVEDLTWDELRPWRSVIQSRFDRARDVSRLSALSEVTLEMGQRSSIAPAALLLAGWLGSRLQWTRPERLAPNRVRVKRSGGEILIEFQPGLVADTVRFGFEDGGEPMRWTSKELRTESPSGPLSRTLHRHAFNPVAVGAQKMAIELAPKS